MRPRRTLAHRRVLQRLVGEVEVAALERRWLVRTMGPHAFGHAGGRCADFGRNALQTASWVSTYGPPMRSRQYGTAGKTPSSVSLIAFGWPGRFKISARPRMTPTWRDRIAVGTYLRLTCRICSPKPGRILCATDSVASGVTSRGAGPGP